MSTVTQLTTVTADLIGAQTPPTASVKNPPKAQRAPSKDSEAAAGAEPSQRLVIKEGAQAGVLIYTVLDRATGEVLVQIPREEVIRIAARPNYEAGQVIDTKV